MSKIRPYEFVPTFAIVILLEEYGNLVKAGMFKLKPEFDKMKEELDIRFAKPKEDKQISIEEYMRSRSKGE